MIPGGGADGKNFSAPAFTKMYDMEAKVGTLSLRCLDYSCSVLVLFWSPAPVRFCSPYSGHDQRS